MLVKSILILLLNLTISYSKLDEGATLTKNSPANNSTLTPYGLPDPVVRTVPKVPLVKLLAMTPAWVRVKNEFDDIVFEKTLQERETYIITKELFTGQLRAGNAQNVYFVVDSEVFGPLSAQTSVVKEVSLDPQSIKANYIISLEASNSYFAGSSDNAAIDTAEVID